MTPINGCFIEHMLFVLCADDDQLVGMYSTELEIRAIITEKIVPYILNAREAYLKQLKDALAYFLSTNNLFERFFANPIELIFVVPSPERVFFEWVWEILYPHESYIGYLNPKDCKVIWQVDEPRILYRSMKDV